MLSKFIYRRTCLKLTKLRKKNNLTEKEQEKLRKLYFNKIAFEIDNKIEVFNESYR